MADVQFYCPKCAFRIDISKMAIPENATQCKCPSCEKTVSITEGIRITDHPKAEKQSSLDEIIDECIDSLQFPRQKDNPRQNENTNIGQNVSELIEKALSEIKVNNDLEAMHLLEKAENISSTPQARSYLAYCKAKVYQEYGAGIQACFQTLKEDPYNADHYLNLGRIYLLAGDRGLALDIFRKGIKLGSNPQIMQALRTYEVRKPPVFKSLPRHHSLNRNFGKILSVLGLR